ncbi:MAG: autotransporter-associated beta strand repeat-containing protein [Akkermansiaceae bacterium]|jgi:autotransporter-associated beta strand protein|nr:autotransporter-associated beta strand repeat-containing protein [Akkermansiaceae bacterium]
MKTLSIRAQLGSLAALTVVASSPATAADYSWQVAGTNNNWSTAPGDTNWFIDGGAVLSPWADANAARFEAATGESVSVVGTVTPSSMVVANNGNWTLAGSGVLAGTGGLTKGGTGTLTFTTSTAATYSGGTVINGGVVSYGTGGTTANTTTVSALGTGPVTVNSSGVLRLWIRNNAAFTITNGLVLNGGTILNEDGNHTLSGNVTVDPGGATLRSKWAGKNLALSGILSGSGAVTVARSADGGGHPDSTIILTNSNTYSGGTTVNSAILQLGNAVATDKGPTGVIRGTLNVNSPGTVILGFTNALGYATGQKIDTLNINGGTVTHTANGDNGWGVTYNLTGGLLQSTGTGNFSFGNNTAVNTLASTASSTINGLIRLRESNTADNVNFTVADGVAPLDLVVNATINESSGGRGITKAGAGIMLLNGSATHTGSTQVTGGTLLLGPSGQLATSPVVVGGSGGFFSAAAGKTIASISAANNATLGAVAATGVTTTVTGALQLADGGTIQISPIVGAGTVPGTYDLFTAGSITGTGNVALATTTPFGPTRATGSVAVSGNKIQLTLTDTGDSLVWNNAAAAGAATGVWDTNTTANWNNAGPTDVFQAYDSVTFNDSVAAGTAKTVNVSGVVAPAAITVNNSTGNDYTLNATALGAGAVAGSGSIVKSGTGTLTLGANLVYGTAAGDITAGGGTLNLGGKTLNNHGSLTVSGGGTLSNGTLPVTGNFNLQSGTVSATLNGAGSLTKSTAGTVVLSANNAITGASSITEGTLQIGAAGNTGTLGTAAVNISPGAVLAFNRNDRALTVANPISGSGTIQFNGVNTGDTGGGVGNELSGYGISGNNSGFNGSIVVTNSRLSLDTPLDIGSAAVSTGTNGGLYITAGTYPNAFTLSGQGWGEPTGLLGALRIQGGTISGPVTLAGNTRITSHSGAGTISGNIGESGGSRNLEIGGSGTATNFNTVLTLSGTNTYTGTTSVGTPGGRTATLNLDGSLASTAVTVNPGSTLNGDGSIAGSLTFATGSTTLGVNLATPATLTVGGAVAFNGTTAVNLIPASNVLPGGTITLMNYASASGSPANLTLANAANYRQALFNLGATSLTLDIGSKAITWTGAGGLVWNVATTSNWTDTSVASPYYQGDVVTFDDSAGAANGSVSYTAALTPAAITINNSTAVPYTFTGAGSISGGASLLKNGNGVVNVAAAMTYSGGTTINGGTLSVDGDQQANRQAVGSNIVVNNSGIFEIRGVNAMPTGANGVNVTLNSGAILQVVSGASTAFPTAIQSHAHINNLTLNGGTVSFLDSGSGTSYNNESVQINGTLTVTGSSPSVITSLLPTDKQGLALGGNRTFAVANVTGDAAVDLRIDAEVENTDQNNGALTKTGTGTLSLAVANSYTAGTTVSQGTLMVENGTTGSATGTGAVSIAAAATLAGEGGATGTVNIAGTLAPGNGGSEFGFIRLGATTLSGSFACDVNGLDFDSIDVLGNLTLTGATLALDAAGANQPSYLLATYSGTKTGEFTVTGLPSGYQVVYDEAVSPKEIRLEQQTGSAYDAYETANNISGAGAEADSDGDGVSNGLEFVLGGISNPASNANSAALLPEIEDLGANVRFRFHLTDAAASITPKIWDVEIDDDLTGTWTTAVDPGNATIQITPDGVSPESGAAWSRVDVTIPKSVARRFLRLRVTLP